MTVNDIIDKSSNYILNAAGNYISEQVAISEQVKGMQIYEEPLFAFGQAADPLFYELKKPEAIGGHFRLPVDWMNSAKTVISVFLPFTEVVKRSNGKDFSWPSNEWLHGRIEGQAFLKQFLAYLSETIQAAGCECVIPSEDKQYFSKSKFSGDGEDYTFTSNWSERHIGYVCGLGTFGLSKGLITKKGMAGRLGSIVTSLELPPTERSYTGIYEYCTMCGVCIKHCPAQAISFEKGKNHALCSDFLDKTREKSRPRYGCGKCQVNVPCESRNPKGRLV